MVRPGAVSSQAKGQFVLNARFKAPQGADVAGMLRALPMISMVEVKPESENWFQITSSEDMAAREAIFELCVKEKWILTEMTPVEASLEDTFRELTTN